MIFPFNVQIVDDTEEALLEMLTCDYEFRNDELNFQFIIPHCHESGILNGFAMHSSGQSFVTRYHKGVVFTHLSSNDTFYINGLYVNGVEVSQISAHGDSVTISGILTVSGKVLMSVVKIDQIDDYIYQRSEPQIRISDVISKLKIYKCQLRIKN